MSVRFSLLLFFLTLPGLSINAQNSADSTDLVVRRVRFSGNKSFNSVTLERIARTKTNREFLGIPGFTPWYWINRRNPKRGEQASVLVRSVMAKDIDRLESFYRSQGFLEATVDTTVTEFEAGKVEVSFKIKEGSPSRIRRLIYSGISEVIDPEFRRRFFKENSISTNVENDSTIRANTRFTNEKVTAEQDRIITLLKDYGRASAIRDSVKAYVKRDEENPLLLDVLFRIRPGPVYRFGDVFIDLVGPDGAREFSKVDTIVSPVNPSFSTFIRSSTTSNTKLSVVSDQLTITPGSVFDNSKYLRSVNEFQSLPMLRIQRFNLSEGGGIPDYSNLNLPVYFDLQTLPKYQLRTDLFGMQRVGLGAGAGLRLTNNNIFGRAHQLEFGVNGNFEYVGARSELLRALEANINYSIPKFAFPFRSLNKRPYFESTQTQYQISASQVNQINFDINANLRLNWRFNVQHSRELSSTLDLLEIEWTDASESAEFRSSLDEQVQQGVIDTLVRNLILNDYDPQVNSTIRYTFRNTNTNLVRRDRGFFREYSVEVSGNLPYLADRYLITPDEIESTVPSFVNPNDSLTYSQFIKVSLDRRRYLPVNQNTVFATRFFAGLAYAYGENQALPINRRYFAGGSNDIRAWFPLRLGPGGFQDQVTFNGGDIKLLASAEWRSIVLRDVLAANWIFTLFTDAGNVWQGPQSDQNITARFQIDEFYKQIAVGSGFGLRFDWEFVIFRFDFAYRIHDLNQGWFQQTHLVRDARLQFGIGHTF